MKEKRGMARFGNTAVAENLIKHGGPLKESTTGIGRPPTQNHRCSVHLRSDSHIWNRSTTEAALVYMN
jgi:hypothetical protein